MSLKPVDRRTLFDAGFTTYEIKIFHFATDPKGNRLPKVDLSNPVWQEMIRERGVRSQRIKDAYFKTTGNEMSRWKMAREINKFYARHLVADPFDWLKLAYRRIRHLKAEAAKTASSRLSKFPGARGYKVVAQFD